MNIAINFRSGIPIYVQIIDQIKHMIATGELQPGDQLPTVRQLAADLRVNFNTIARAYRLLDEERIISTQHGRGTFILELPSAENGERLRRQDLLRLTRYYLTEASNLGYDPKKVSEIFKQQLELWKASESPPSPEDDTI
jgi:GntR family transcriptional regulator